MPSNSWFLALWMVSTGAASWLVLGDVTDAKRLLLAIGYVALCQTPFALGSTYSNWTQSKQVSYVYLDSFWHLVLLEIGTFLGVSTGAFLAPVFLRLWFGWRITQEDMASMLPRRQARRIRLLVMSVIVAGLLASIAIILIEIKVNVFFLTLAVVPMVVVAVASSTVLGISVFCFLFYGKRWLKLCLLVIVVAGLCVDKVYLGLLDEYLDGDVHYLSLIASFILLPLLILRGKGFRVATYTLTDFHS